MNASDLPQVRQVVDEMSIEHDEHDATKDCFILEFVAANPTADQATLDREALDVFELIRPLSEQWGFKTASLLAASSGAYLFSSAPVNCAFTQARAPRECRRLLWAAIPYGPEDSQAGPSVTLLSVLATRPSSILDRSAWR